MSQPTLRLARYEDLFDLPAHIVGEIIAGELHTQPRPTPKHAHAYSSMGFLLGNPFHGGQGGPGGWWILDEPELHLGEHILVPDLAGWRRARMPNLPETAWFELHPDWVCEILSPSTARIDRALKMPLYAQFGVAHLWLVDPNAQTLEVYALQENGHWTLRNTLKDHEPVSEPPFDTITFTLGRLWA